MRANSLDNTVSDPGHDSPPSRRALVRAGVWTAPAVILAAAAPAAASASYSTTMSGLLCLYPENNPTYAVRTSSQGLVHDTVNWSDGVGIQIWGGAPGAAVGQITVNITFTPDQPGQSSDMVAEPAHPAQLVFVNAQAGDRVVGTLRYLYVPAATAEYDSTGTYDVLLSAPFSFGNAVRGEHGTFHLGLFVGGQAAMYYHWHI